MHHECTLTEANTHSWLALCSCGWTSNVHYVRAVQRKKGGRKTWLVDAAKDGATAAWKDHAAQVSEEVA